MKKFILILSFLLIPALSYAQVEGPVSLTASGSCATVSTINCAVMPVSGGQNTILFNIIGAAAGTNIFEFSPDNQVTWRSLTVVNLVALTSVTSTTAAGTFAVTNPGYTHVRVRMSVTGTNTTLIRALQNNSMVGINFGGGGSTIGAVTQGAASDASANWTVNCVVGCTSASSDPDDASIAAGQTNSNTNALNNVFDGTVWRRLTTSAAGSGLATGLFTVQGNASGTAIPVSGTVTASQGTAASLNATVVGTGTFATQLTGATNNINNIAGTITLPTLAATSTKQSDGTQKSQIVDGAGNVIGSTANAIDVNIKSGAGSGGTAITDNAAFTAGTTSETPIGGFYHATRDSVTDGRNAAVAITVKRSQYTTLDTPLGDSAMDDTLDAVKVVNATAANLNTLADTELPAAAAAADNMANPTAPFVLAGLMCYDGATWDRCTDQPLPAGTNVIGHIICDSGCSSTAGFADNAAFTFGTTVINPIGGVLDDTSTNVATENSAAIARITPQKALHTNLRNQAGTEVGTSTTPLQVTLANTGANTNKILVTPDSVALPANQSVNISQMNGVTVLMNAGATGTGSPRVTEANDSQLSAGVGAAADAAATVGSTGSLTAKQRLMTTQLDAIQTSVQLIDNAQTGDSAFYRTAAGVTEDEHEIKATTGILYSVAISNTNAAARYWRCANLTAANTTPGTSTVFIGLAIPGNTAGAGFTHVFGPNGLAFSTALTCWFVTGAADSDVAEVAANEIKATYSFK